MTARPYQIACLALAACAPPAAAPSLRVQPPQPTTTDTVIVVAEHVGRGPEPDSFEFTWFVDGELEPDLDGDTLPADRTRRGQAWRVVVSALRRGVRGVPAYTFAIIENSPPQALVAWATPAPTAEDELRLLVDARDADGDAVSLRFSWTRDGEPTPFSGPAVPASSTLRGESWRVTVVASDAEAEAEPIVREVRVGNSRPEVDGPSIAPRPAFVDTPLRAEHGPARDADGDPISLRYRWYSDGELVLDGPDPELPTGAFQRGSQIVASVTPSDPFEEGAEASSEAIVIANSPPTAPVVAVAPERPRAGEPLRCAIAAPATDADGDALSHAMAWLRDGAPTELGERDGDALVLPADATAAWDTWTCRATASDGADEGPPAHAQVWIRGDWAAAAAGEGHTCGLRDDATLWCWGGNGSGQLGDATFDPRSRPVQVDGAWRAVAAGRATTCGLDASGGLWCWGANNSGQLGDGSREPSATPVPVLPGTRWARVAVGYAHVCAIDEAETAWCWGWSGNHQTGDGGVDRADRLTPRRVAGDRRYTHIDAGYTHTCALDAAGAAWCWGSGLFGQLGDGSAPDRAAPVAVAGGRAFDAIAVGWAHSCALGRGDRAVWCWGRNRDYGQLGDGSGVDRSTPVRSLIDAPVLGLTTGFYHTCAVREGGEAWCWGGNARGQLGDGSRADRWEPIRIDPAASALYAGFQHTCAIGPTATLDCWGLNDSGQLGDDATTTRLSAVEVLPP